MKYDWRRAFGLQRWQKAFANRQQRNEVCVKALNGWLESIRIGDKTIRNANFFPFNNASLPGRVEQWIGDKR